MRLTFEQALRTDLTVTFTGDLFEALEAEGGRASCLVRRAATINPESFRGWPHSQDGCATAAGLIPKRIEIKPIVRRKPGVMLETIDITLRPMLDVFSAAVAIQDYLLGESLEINLVTIASTIEAKE